MSQNLAFQSAPMALFTPVFSYSVQAPFVSLLDATTATSGLPQALLTAGGDNVIVLPTGATYMVLGWTLTTDSLATTPVVAIFGVDGAGNIQPLYNSVGDRLIGADGSIVQVDSALYAIAESAPGQHVIDLRGASQVIIIVTTAATAASGCELLAKLL